MQIYESPEVGSNRLLRSLLGVRTSDREIVFHGTPDLGRLYSGNGHRLEIYGDTRTSVTIETTAAKELRLNVLPLLESAGARAFTAEVALVKLDTAADGLLANTCLLYTSPSPRDRTRSRMPSSA